MPAPEATPAAEVGTFCLVLHSHLPWLLGHGRWPVGEEWLFQAWTRSYLRVSDVLGRLAAQGHRHLLTLGVTPVLADQLDSPLALAGARAWVADWSLRAQDAAARPEPALRSLAADEFRAATWAQDQLAGSWRSGGSAVLRSLAERGAVELLGGPATHPFLPLLEPEVARLALAVGLDDARWRLGPGSTEPQGIWAPECGHSSGLELLYAAVGVRHAVYDEATLAASGRRTSRGWRMAGTDVVAVGRDLGVTDRIWSSRTGYPTGAAYRDFHAIDAGSGLNPYAVTSALGGQKRWYDRRLASAQVRRDAAAFVEAVRHRLREVAACEGRPGLVVAAYDTELFGHWWHEGPAFLELVLRTLPGAGVRVTTLSRALHGDDRHAPLVDGEIQLADGSWGAGKDWSVWDGSAVRGLVDEGYWVQRRLLDVLDRTGPEGLRRPDLDQLLRQALLALSSDWAFMVTRAQAADYALRRAAGHRSAFHRLAALIEEGSPAAGAEAVRQRELDGPFPWLDARPMLARSPA